MTEKVRSKKRIVLIVVLALVGFFIILPAIGALLFFLPPALPMRSLESIKTLPGENLPLDIHSVRLSSQGVSLTDDTFESAIAAASLNIDSPYFGLTHARVALGPNKMKIGARGVFTFPQDVPLISGMRVPLGLTLYLAVESGEVPKATLTRITIGRFPIFLFPSWYVNTDLYGDISLPEGISVSGTTVSVDLARLQYEGMRIKEIRFTEGTVTAVPDIPENAGTNLASAAREPVKNNEAILKKESAAGGKAGAMAGTLLTLSPLLDGTTVPSGIVEYATGTATASYSGSPAIRLEPGDRLLPGAVLTTGADSSLEVLLADRSLISLAENTTAILDAIPANGTGDTSIGLPAGAILTKVAKIAGRGDYRIKTPVMVCGVRGTEFLVASNEDGSAVLAVVEGSVMAVSSGGEQTVSGGKELSATETGELSKVKNMSRANKDAIEKAAFRTGENALDEPMETDPLAQFWTIARPLLAQWNELSPEEQNSLEAKYSSLIPSEALEGMIGK